MERPPLGPPLPICLSEITAPEVDRAVAKLMNNKAVGEDGIPAEYWKAIFSSNCEARTWLVSFCNSCWSQQQVPEEWHLARVSAIFKKGDPAACGNYRPISLLNIGYKVFASILLSRLQNGGAESRVRISQFGFRRGLGTEDAIYVARRLIEHALAWKNGSVALLALDWARAFDSIDPAGLLRALVRFGVPQYFVDVIAAIYTQRSFVVSEAGRKSELRMQEAGISQGCPLSPFLFSILMTVIMHDASEMLKSAGLQVSVVKELCDLLYADDTLLVGRRGSEVTQFLECVSKVGAEYGLQLHNDKFQLLCVGNPEKVLNPDGTEIKAKEVMQYLGANLRSDGDAAAELGRRIGLAEADFIALSRVWKHSALSRSRKIELYQAMVESKLLYGLSTFWLRKADKRRLDGFQNRCLRRILNIKPSYVSRVSNLEVLKSGKLVQLSTILLRRQLLHFGKVARSAPEHPLRAATFVGKSMGLRIDFFVRKLGRPRLYLPKEMLRIGSTIIGQGADLEASLRDAADWKSRVWQFR